MEILDIVDENDNVIKQLSVKEAYASDNIKRTSWTLIFRDDTHREVVVQKRSQNQYVSPGRWSFVSGLVSSGEEYEENARREVAEEMFHKKEAPELTFKHLFKILKYAENDPGMLTAFSTVFDGDFSVDPHEVEKWKWVELDFLMKDVEKNPKNYTGTLPIVLREYKKLFLR